MFARYQQRADDALPLESCSNNLARAHTGGTVSFRRPAILLLVLAWCAATLYWASCYLMVQESALSVPASPHRLPAVALPDNHTRCSFYMMDELRHSTLQKEVRYEVRDIFEQDDVNILHRTSIHLRDQNWPAMRTIEPLEAVCRALDPNIFVECSNNVAHRRPCTSVIFIAEVRISW